jgi:hypothetical protein
MLIGNALCVDLRQAHSMQQAEDIQEFCRCGTGWLAAGALAGSRGPGRRPWRWLAAAVPAGSRGAARSRCRELARRLPAPPRRHHQEAQGEHAGGGPQLPLLDMARTTFLQLCSLQVGAGSIGLFSHQGSCEHRLVVLDLRALHRTDPQHRSAYPLALAQQQRTNSGRCQVCNVAVATLVVVDDPDAPCSPCQMCAGCHEMLEAEEQVGAGLRRGPSYRVYPLRE